MKVRVSTVEKGKTFIYNDVLYIMGSVKRDSRGARFRWVQNAETGKWRKFTVNGNAMVTLGKTKVRDSIGTPQEEASASSAPRRVVRRPVKKTAQSTREKVARVLVSKGANTYRVTAKWWSASQKKWQRKEFRVNANSAAAALERVQKTQENKTVRVTFTVAKVES